MLGVQLKTKSAKQICADCVERGLLTLTAKDALRLLRETELASGMRFCGIINNSNLGRLTEPSTVEATLAEGEKLAALAGIPVMAVTAVVTLPCAKAVRIQNLTKQLF